MAGELEVGAFQGQEAAPTDGSAQGGVSAHPRKGRLEAQEGRVARRSGGRVTNEKESEAWCAELS